MGFANDLSSLGRGAVAATVKECVEGGVDPVWGPTGLRFFFVQFPPILQRLSLSYES